MAPRLITLAILLIAPTASAMAVEVDLETRLPDTPHTINYPGNTNGLPAEPGCDADGRVAPIPVGAGFRFQEEENESGCAEAMFEVPVPPGAAYAEVRFDADRIVRALDTGIRAQIRQELIIYGDRIRAESIYDPLDGSQGMQAHAFAIQPTQRDLRLGWFFSDDGETERSPTPLPSEGVALTASVQNHRVLFTIPVQAEDQESIHYQADTRTILTRQTTHFSVPDTGTPGAIRFLEERPASLTGPNGPIDVSRLVSTAQGWLLEDAAPGRYAATVESLQLGSPTLFPMLPITVVGATLLSGGGAAFAQYRWSVHAHPRQRVSIRWLWITLATGATVFALIAAWAATAGRLSVQRIPLDGAAWAFYLAMTALTMMAAAATVNALVQRRRGLELYHHDALAAANGRLARSNRDLEEFAAVASHDLQAPLRRIVGCTQLLDRQVGETLDESPRNLMKIVVENGIHMQRMIGDLLELSRLHQAPVRREAVDLRELFQQILHDLRPDIDGAGVDVSLEVNGEVDGAPSLLRELFHNLVVNAIKYRQPEHPWIRIRTEALEGQMGIHVQDNGLGIPPRDLDKVFQMFHRSHGGNVSGSGIGLAIAKRIVEMHGGQIDVASIQGQGTTFSVYLPRVVPPTPTNVR